MKTPRSALAGAGLFIFALIAASLWLLREQRTPAPTPVEARVSEPPATMAVPMPPPRATPPAPIAPATKSGRIHALREEIAAARSDTDAIIKLKSELHLQEANEILAAVGTREFDEKEAAFFLALSLEFGRLAQPADLHDLASRYRALPDSDARNDIANLLRGVYRPELVGTLQILVNDAVRSPRNEETLLAAAAWAVAQIGQPQAIEHLIRMADLVRPEQKPALGAGLTALQNPAALPFIIATAQGNSSPGAHHGSREAAISLLGQLPAESSRDTLLRLHRSPDRQIAEWAGDAIARLRSRAPALFRSQK
jgi:HEAT repeat protein